MYKIPENTHFIGKNLLYVPQCRSTNILAAELGQQPETPDGTVIITDHQTAGRGQRGNQWESQPGQNLTFSLLLKPGFLSVKDQFKLNEAISIGLVNYVTTKVAEKVLVKWPNDILIQDLKVCGTLIENHISSDEIMHSIVGIGLNVNQLFFPYPQAGSLKLFTGMDYFLENELTSLLQELELSYLALKQGGSVALEEKYLQLLYRKNELRRFKLNGEIVEGVITGVNDAGQLMVEIGAEKRCFGVKEITFLT